MSVKAMAVILRVPIEASWKHSARLQVFTDSGSGTVDTNDPLLADPVEVFPNAVRPRGIGADPIGAVPIGHGRPATARRKGIGAHPLGSIPIGSGLAVRPVAVMVAEGYGTYKFAAQAVDEAGNAQSAALVEFEEFVSGEAPPPLARLDYASFNAGTDQVTFDLAL